VIAGALVGNEIKKLMPTATIEKFKINYSKSKYSEIYEELLMYTVDLQASPGYEQILKEKLRDAMGRNKLKI
jgi:folate-dependent phosphoribosylglycinamide formyltransferase PurN